MSYNHTLTRPFTGSLSYLYEAGEYLPVQTSGMSVLSLALLWALSSTVHASAGCLEKFHSDLVSIEASLVTLIQRQVAIDQALVMLSDERAALMTELGALVGIDRTMTKIVAQFRMVKLYDELERVRRTRVTLEKEAYKNNEALFDIRNLVPQTIQREMRKCVQETVTAKRRVSNFGVQGFTLVATAEFGIPFQRKAAYIALREMLPGS